MDFGRALCVGRAVRRLTQKELAERASLDPSFVSMIEANRRQPTDETIDRIAQALDLPVHVLKLLGAEEDDLRGTSVEKARVMADQLLDLLVRGEVKAQRGRGGKRAERAR